MIKLRTFIITILIAIAVIAAQYWLNRSSVNGLTDKFNGQIEEMKETTQKRIDSVSASYQQTLTNLINENQTIKEQSQHWYNEAQRRSVNPDYDFDFITAAGIISNSAYKPGE